MTAAEDERGVMGDFFFALGEESKAGFGDFGRLVVGGASGSPEPSGMS